MNKSQPPAERPIKPAEGRRLTVLYVFALSTVALLSIGAQWLIQRQLDNGESDSRVINIAGRQRMLSQRLAKAALRLSGARDGEWNPAQQEVKETLALWARSHAGLQYGDTDARLPGGNSEEAARLFAAIEANFQAMKAAAQDLGDASPGDPIDGSVTTIQQNEAPFLAGMDALVSQYVVEAERRVARLRRLEYAILALTLSVLLAEGLLIFRPAVRRIEHTVARLGRLSERLRRAKEEAESANAAKTRFLANVSHELRTPMTAVLGMTDLAREATDERQRARYLSIVKEAGDSLLGLLNDLIDLARIDAGHLSLASEPFDPRDVVARVVRMMDASAREKGLALSAEVDGAHTPTVVGDERRLEQVLLNLAANAIKSTGAGSVTAACAVVSASPAHAVLRFWVRDTGVGIDPLDQERIFEPFTQLKHAPGAGPGGAGLGLAICRRIADAMGASIDVTSTPGHGATVALTCELPLARSSEAAPEPVETPVSTRALSVLVVEDTEVNQILLNEVLSRAGHRVTIACTGEEALEKRRRERFDIALVDLQLPGIDGAATAREFVRIDRETGATPTPVVCVTAHAGPASAGKHAGSASGGFEAVVTKPLQRELLLRTIARLVGSGADEHSSEPSHADREELQRDLAAAYLRDAPSQREQLEGAVRAARLDTVRVIAHRFLGQVQHFDAHDLADRLGAIESACEAGDAATVATTAPATLSALCHLEERLRRQASEGAASPTCSAVET